ncbi:HAMP domain-containing sensor histidine kinase [Cognatishimia sp. SS12]|uniref:sensor histidine kinase n=1 Tax=Cognatishimia sp. SS12 TaxID=2979465 RepID=UPI00232DD417|nr:HAMP domain-containing sensor histidine kinase [Cognatishimia sp. SS12]MDC0738480.1 HAMP domain-containing sensor histidine kinase [Cognatishimia sp. SS12]
MTDQFRLAPPDALDEFIYVLTHDIRASLRALTEVPLWIEEDLEEAGIALDKDMRRNLQFLKSHSARMDQMLVDLLAYSRVGRLEGARRLALYEAFQTHLKQCGLPKGLALSDAGKEVHSKISERDLALLFDALISNAAAHNPAEDKHLHVAITQEREHAKLSFVDNGPGVPTAHHEKIFDLMFTSKRRDEAAGSGMGLAQVRRIATHYGGTARARHAETGGLQIDVLLPRADPAV